MIETALQWWQARSQREHIMLAIMLALLVPVLIWVLVIRPLDTALETARSDHWAASQRLVQVRADAEAIKAPSTAAFDGAQSIVTRLSSGAGLVPSRLDPGADGRVMVGLSSAKPVALRTWLKALDTEGVFVETITIRPNSDATVSVDAVLRARKG
jgi:general secretion pathway protein M